MAQLHDGISKRSQLIVTFLVKSTVVLHFSKSILHPVLLDLLDVLKHDFGNDKFGLPIVLAIHIPPLSGDIPDAFIEGNGQRLQILEQLLSLIHKSRYMLLKVNVFMTELKLISVQSIKLGVGVAKLLQGVASLSANLIEFLNPNVDFMIEIVTFKSQVLLVSLSVLKLAIVV